MKKILFAMSMALLAISCNTAQYDATVLERINNSLLQAAEGQRQHSDYIYVQFEMATMEFPAKVKPWKDKVDLVKIETETAIAAVEAWSENKAVDKTTVQQAISKLSEFYQSLIPDPERYALLQQKITELLNIGGEKLPDSELLNSTFAASQISAIRLAEGNILNYLYSEIETGSFRFSEIKALVVPKSKFVRVGDYYESEISLAAIDTTIAATVLIDGKKNEMHSGKFIYRTKATDAKTVNFSGAIQVKSPYTGEIIEYPFAESYEVIK